MATDFAYMSAQELAHLVSSKQATAVEITNAALHRLESLEVTLNAFVTPTPELALAAAARVDLAVAQKAPLPPLAGVPISVKDLIDVAGIRTTFGSQVMRDNVASVDAPSVERIKEAGACIVGKTTTTEFGCKAGGGDSPLTGITRNPWNTTRSPGGSSAGAASSVAAGVTPLALGTDGGGSCRIPAALCGLVGVKAQYGRVPVFPASATPSLGHVGAIARTAVDAAQLLQVLAGFDARDPASVAQEVPNFVDACSRGVANLRIAWSPNLGYARVSDEVRQLTSSAVDRLESLGCIVQTVEHVFREDPIDLWSAEFYGGVGLRLKSALDHTSDLLDPAVVEMLADALYGQSVEQYFLKYFKRFEIREEFRKWLEPYDVLITPTLPVAELLAGVNVPPELPDRNIVSWVYYTYPFNLTGNPAASVPCGFSQNGMPVGLQIVAKTLREADLFRVAGALEATAPWSHLIPTSLREVGPAT